MVKNNRKDSWTPEEDKLLGDTVINVVGNGGTQVEAFNVVASQVGRTASAIGFRWNSEVRKIYAEELSSAKTEGRKNKPKKYTPEITKMQEKEFVHTTKAALTTELDTVVSDEETQLPEEIPFDIDALILFLNNYKHLIVENENLNKKLVEVEKGKQVAEQQLNEIKQELSLDGNDFGALFTFLQRAQSLARIVEKKEAKKVEEAAI
ncbi:hypothetical protein ACWKTZ_25675 [Bacillus cereus]